MTADSYLIDFDRILEEKFPGKRIPGIVRLAGRKLIHQDWMNSVIPRCRRDSVGFCDDVLTECDIKIDAEGLENVPADGTPLTFASNHPLGFIDGMALCSIISHRFGPVKIPVNDFLMYFKALAPLCIPVNKVGGQARNLARRLDEAFASRDHMLFFPAGSCSRKIGGRVQDHPWSKTFITKSAASGRPVVPVHFTGENPPRFYAADYLLTKVLRVKTNLTAYFLPDAFYHSRHKSFKIIFGKPVGPSTFDNSRTPLEWAAQMRELAYSL